MSSSKLPQSGISIEEEIQISVGDVHYVLIRNKENFLSFDDGNVPTLVLVYLAKPGENISRSVLRDFRTSTLDQDDIVRPEFYSNVIFYGSREEDLQIDSDALEELTIWNTKKWKVISGNPAAKVAPGPYVFARGETWQHWRVYHDFNAAFMCAFKPPPDSLGTRLDSPQAGAYGRIIVPSRCYYQPSKSRPLDGVRIGVKDNIDIAGHKTTLCNRAWEDLYPAKANNAACVQVLLDAGAIIVGKTKLQAMIMREEPLEAVEFTAPFNPRGDGYQVPSGSSHGSAVAVGSYDWLDFSIGSDTNGSGRKPAHYNGCFSIRPSTGIMNTDGVVGQFPQFDMPVFYGRDLSKCSEFISVWYGNSPMLRAPSKLPVKILYPLDYLPTPNKAQSRLIDNFVEGLESAMQVRREEISLAALWKGDCPDGPENQDIAEYLRLAGSYPYYRDAYYNLSDFRKQYADKHGKPPFVHRAMHWQWNVAKQISAEERDMYWRRSETYRHWLLDRVFKVNSSDFITIMIFPIEIGKPNYRDSELPPLSILSGYSSLNMSPMMRAPEFTTIVGEIMYDSIVTEREEPLPVGVSVIGAPGTDLYLADLVEKGMKARRIPTKLKTGRSIY